MSASFSFGRCFPYPLHKEIQSLYSWCRNENLGALDMHPEFSQTTIFTRACLVKPENDEIEFLLPSFSEKLRLIGKRSKK